MADSGKNLGNVIGGHKATLNNPNVSEEAKEQSQEVLKQLEQQAGDTSGEKNLGNVIGGYKATLNNPNVSDDAKQHAQEVLAELQGGDSNAGGSSDLGSGGSDGKDPTRVASGLKATLTNPNTSDEAKQSAQARLDEMDGGGSAGGNSGNSAGGDDGKNPDYVARGLKATLTNPNTSDEAKQSAQERLDNM